MDNCLTHCSSLLQSLHQLLNMLNYGSSNRTNTYQPNPITDGTISLEFINKYCWRPQEWILEVGLQSRKTINKSEQSMRSQERTASWPGEPQDCNQAAQECTAEQDNGAHYVLC
jgi:hypothetical protein